MVRFACLNRSADETRLLMRQARAGRILDMSEHQPSKTEEVYEPIKCVRYY